MAPPETHPSAIGIGSTPPILRNVAMKCPNCSFESPEGARFCENCGQPLARTCPNCGQPVSPSAKFCGNCGVHLAAAEGPAATPAAVGRLASLQQAAPTALQQKILSSHEPAPGPGRAVCRFDDQGRRTNSPSLALPHRGGEKRGDKGQAMIADLLRRLPLFAGLNDQDMQRLLDMAEPVTLQAGEFLMEEGTPV